VRRQGKSGMSSAMQNSGQIPLSAREPRSALRSSGMQQAGLTPRVARNPLLMRDDVGRAKQSCYDLPDEHFSYGRPGNQDVEGAREISMRWVSHTPSRQPEGATTDFKNLNKRAALAKVTTPKDLRHFKNLIEDQLAPQYSASSPGQVKDTIPSDVIQGFTYGRKVRPSTPIQEVISYRFADKSEQELNRFYSDFRDVQEASRTQVRKIPLTAASRGHASAHKKAVTSLDQGKELFKIGKFKRVPPRVVTNHHHHKSEDCCDDIASYIGDQAAFNEDELDSFGRGGSAVPAFDEGDF